MCEDNEWDEKKKEKGKKSKRSIDYPAQGTSFVTTNRKHETRVCTYVLATGSC